MLCALAAVSVCACNKDDPQPATEAASETAQVEATRAATPDEVDGTGLKSFITSFDNRLNGYYAKRLFLPSKF